MSEKTVRVQVLPSLPVLLFVTFLVLKLTGHIGWSWVWVTAPLWIPFGGFLVVFAVVLFVATIWALLDRS